MKKLIFSVLLMAVASVCVFTSCGSDDDDVVIGTSYWNANDLQGHWVSSDGVSSYTLDFNTNGTFTCNIGRGTNYQKGNYKKANSSNPQHIAVQFPKNDDTWYDWTIEWLSSDKKRMKFGVYDMKRE